MDRRPRRRRRPRPAAEARRPTVRQIYAIARELCDRCEEEFPETRAAASELIARLRGDSERLATMTLEEWMREDD